MYIDNSPKDNLQHRVKPTDYGYYKLFTKWDEEWLFSGLYTKEQLKTRAPEVKLD